MEREHRLQTLFLAGVLALGAALAVTAAIGQPAATYRAYFPIIQSLYPAPIIFVSNRSGRMDIAGVTPDGGPILYLTNTPAWDEIDPIWSPEVITDTPRRIAFASNQYGQFDVFSMLAGGSGVVRLTFTNGADVSPTWSPDGSRIAFASNRTGSFHLWVMNSDGSGVSQVTQNPGTDPVNDRHPHWSPTLNKIVFVSDRDGNDEIYVVNPDGSALTRLTTTVPDDFDPRWSPDGQIAFVSQRDGQYDIYTMRADGTEQTRLTQDAGINTGPSWSPAGDQLVFMSTRDSPASFVNPELYVMDRTGANVKRLIEDELGADDWAPSWWR
jgi:Tol biopolymer transport system component